MQAAVSSYYFTDLTHEWGQSWGVIDMEANCNCIRKQYFHDYILPHLETEKTNRLMLNLERVATPMQVKGLAGNRLMPSYYMDLDLKVFGLRIQKVPFIVVDKLFDTKRNIYMHMAPFLLGSLFAEHFLAEFISTYMEMPLVNVAIPLGFSEYAFGLCLMTHSRENGEWMKVGHPAEGFSKLSQGESSPSENLSSEPSDVSDSNSGYDSPTSYKAVADPEHPDCISLMIDHQPHQDDLWIEDLCMGNTGYIYVIPPCSWQTFYVKPRKPVKGSVVIFQHVECQLPVGSNIISTHMEARTWHPVPVCIQNFGDTDLVIDQPLRVASLLYVDQWLPPSCMHFEFQDNPQLHWWM